MNTYYSQETLQKRHNEINQEIQLSKKRISKHWQSLTTPTTADTQVQHWVNQAEKALAVYDGFMLMYKLAHRFSAFSGLFKRKSKKTKK